MSSDTFHSDAPADPAAGAAVIHPVTPEMMDEVAHKAAQLADDVAHHVVPAPEAAVEAVHETSHDHPGEPAGAGGHEAPVPEMSKPDLPIPESTVPDAPLAAMSEAVEAGGSVMRQAAEAGEAAMRDTGEVRAAAGSAMVAAAESVDDAARAAAEHALDRASAATGAGLSGGTDALGQYNAALLGMVQANLSATGEFFAALVKAKSLPEVVAINTDHMRRQFDTLTTQGRDLATLAQRLTAAAFSPLSGSLRRDA